MFDLEGAKRESGLEQRELLQLEGQLRREFAGDELMFELHLIRVLRALREGWITWEEAVREEARVGIL